MARFTCQSISIRSLVSLAVTCTGAIHVRLMHAVICCHRSITMKTNLVLHRRRLAVSQWTISSTPSCFWMLQATAATALSQMQGKLLYLMPQHAVS